MSLTASSPPYLGDSPLLRPSRGASTGSRSISSSLNSQHRPFFLGSQNSPSPSPRHSRGSYKDSDSPSNSTYISSFTLPQAFSPPSPHLNPSLHLNPSPSFHLSPPAPGDQGSSSPNPRLSPNVRPSTPLNPSPLNRSPLLIPHSSSPNPNPHLDSQPPLGLSLIRPSKPHSTTSSRIHITPLSGPSPPSPTFAETLPRSIRDFQTLGGGTNTMGSTTVKPPLLPLLAVGAGGSVGGPTVRQGSYVRHLREYESILAGLPPSEGEGRSEGGSTTIRRGHEYDPVALMKGEMGVLHLGRGDENGERENGDGVEELNESRLRGNEVIDGIRGRIDGVEGMVGDEGVGRGMIDGVDEIGVEWCWFCHDEFPRRLMNLKELAQDGQQWNIQRSYPRKLSATTSPQPPPPSPPSPSPSPSSSSLTSSMSQTTHLYRSILRELRLSAKKSVGTRSLVFQNHLREIVSSSPKDLDAALLETRDLLRSSRIHAELLKRYNPIADMTEEEKIHATARRVGLDTPLEYKKEE